MRLLVSKTAVAVVIQVAVLRGEMHLSGAEQLPDARLRKLTKKKFRIKYGKHRQNWLAPVDVAKASRQNTAEKNARKMQTPVPRICWTISCN